MKSVFLLLGVAAASLFLAGCASHPLALAPVGPNPAITPLNSPFGFLQVFTAQDGETEGDNPTWYRHSDYEITTMTGRRVMRVGNAAGHYSVSPRLVTLEPGRYIVKARGADSLRVQAPVVIRRGLTTRLHLDNAWEPAAGFARADIVRDPDGNPVGWSAGSKL
jgi:hypothetical protein